METIDDILRDIRSRNEGVPLDGESSHCLAEDMLGLADRIEAAVKALIADRDNWRKQALDEDARANATCDKSSQIGDAAALLKALENIKREAETTCEYRDYPIAGAPGERGTCPVVDADWIIDECRAALEKPPMNINKINNYDEMVNAWNDYVRTYHITTIASFFAWLFDKAKGEEQ